MQTVLLDGNIYNKLDNDPLAQSIINHLIKSGAIRIIITPKVRDELMASPFRGVPSWFPIDWEPEAVTVLDHAHLDETNLGEGEVFNKHRGVSSNTSDAIIADSAHSIADVLVSDDRRCRERLKKISEKCKGMNYEEFRSWLEKI